MHKKLITLGLLGASAASAAAVATSYRPASLAALVPTASQQSALQEARPALPRPAPPSAAPAALPPVSSAISSSIARWNSLRQSDSLPFASYASFLSGHRGWPGETAMRRTAEKAIDPGATAVGDVIRYFRDFPALTPTGHARHALALLASGQSDAAREAARKAWTGGVLPGPDEQRLLATFGSALSQADHDARMETLLGSRDTQSAARTLPLTSPQRRPLFEARLALQTNASDASARVAALSGAEGHAGLLADRAAWLRSAGQSLAARQMLAAPRQIGEPPVNAETWLETLLTNARAAASDNQWTLAYDIASKIEGTYPAGTDVSERSYAERDAYTSLAWLGGDVALHKLGRPADAARMFERYARAARSPQTRSKGFYWAARAAHGAGQAAQSNAFLEEAAAHSDQYYGQLSLERLGRRITPPTVQARAPSASERAAFVRKPLVQAVRLLGQNGQWSDQSVFIRALAEEVETDQERLLAGELGRSIGRPDLGVWVAREARNKGSNFYSPTAFPEITLPSAYQRHWSLAHGITRQESSFDREAVSHAGARGLMQLMPGTARETSGKAGLPYDFGRLTKDPSYNIMLGTTYFARLLDSWGGNVPLAVASYNAGPGNVRRWVRENGDPRTPGVDIVRWVEQIPFFETRNYVQRVLENAVVYDTVRAQRAGAETGNRLSYYLGKSGPG